MKKSVFIFFLITLGGFFYAHSQGCKRTVASFIMAPGGYIINGMATLVLQPDSSLLLTFDNNFSTTAGPDLHVFLALQNDRPSAPGNTHYQIGALQSNVGAQSYTIPDSIDITQYNWVLIHCITFNHFWGAGALGSLTGCTSGINDNRSDLSFSIYPNPVKNYLSFQDFHRSSKVIEIKDLLGGVIMRQDATPGENKIDVSNMKTGIYLLCIQNDDGSNIIKRFIKE